MQTLTLCTYYRSSTLSKCYASNMPANFGISISLSINAVFCSLAVIDPRVSHTMDVLSPYISVILIDSSTGSPVHVLMLSIQAVRGLPRLQKE